MALVVDREALLRLPLHLRVAELRDAHGWSRGELAARAGKSRSWVEKVERGVRHLDRLSTLRLLEDVLEARDLLTARPPTPQFVAWQHPGCDRLTRAEPGWRPGQCAHCGAQPNRWCRATVPAARRAA